MKNLSFFILAYFLLSISSVLSQAPFLVKNIHTSFITSSYPQNLTDVNGILFFSANNGTHGFELWKSDGTNSGTVMVKDLTLGSAGTPNMRDFIAINGKLFFTCKTGRELWISDGTVSGTDTLITFTSIGSLQEDSYIELNNNLIFVTQNVSTGDFNLWKSNGTSTTTSILKTFPSGGIIHFSTFKVFNNELYFVADDGISGREVWKTNGTTSGTVLVKDINSGSSNGTPWPDPPFFNEVNGNLFFIGNNGTNGNELWKTDGTNTGTSMIKDIRPGSGGAGINVPTPAGNKLFFTVYISGASSLWVSDGTNSGTIKLTDLSTTGLPMIALDSSKLIFIQNNTSPINYGREPWISDGTVIGTKLLKDIYPGTANGIPKNYFLSKVIDNVLYFKGIDSTHGEELWKTDGTDTGTVLVKDMNPGTGRGFVNNGEIFYDANGVLIFDGIAAGSASATEFWRSDGTDTGTIRFNIDTNLGGSYPKQFTLIDTTLFFVANDGFTGIELYAAYVDSIKKPKVIIVPTSIDEEDNQLTIRAYPNPTSDVLTLELPDDETINRLKIKVSTITGKTMFSQYYSRSKFSIDLSNYPDGIYLIEIQSESGKLNHLKIIKH